MEETKTEAAEKPETDEQEQQQEPERETVQEKETEQESRQAERHGIVNSSEALPKERFETVESSEISESPETGNGGISESSETATTEYGTPEGETETEIATETEAAGGNDGQEDSGDARSEAMSEFYDALAPDGAPQEYYAEMLGYADSVNHTCTVTLNVCLAILLCAGIAAGSILAHSVWSKFR